MTSKSWTLILDFDSTIVQVESLDELAKIALHHHPGKENRVEQIVKLTNEGMAGQITFEDSLQQRLAMLDCTKDHVEKLSQSLVNEISPSFLENRGWIQSHADQIQIFSGGFREFIFPVADFFQIPHSHIHANDFIYSDMGFVEGVYTSNPFSRSGGKVEKAKSMKLKNPIVMVGDGNTDAEMASLGNHVSFLAFIENVARESVIKKADKVVKSFHDVICFLDRID